MARKRPQPGATYRLKVSTGQGEGSIPIGQVVTVREVVPASEPGANAYAASFTDEVGAERAALRENQRAAFPHPVSRALGAITTPVEAWTDEEKALLASQAEELKAFDAAHQADAVVVEWNELAIVETEGGSREVGERPRAWSVGAHEFANLFEEA